MGYHIIEAGILMRIPQEREHRRNFDSNRARKHGRYRRRNNIGSQSSAWVLDSGASIARLLRQGRGRHNSFICLLLGHKPLRRTRFVRVKVGFRGRGTGGFHTNALDTCTSKSRAEILASMQEIFVIVPATNKNQKGEGLL